MLTFSVTGRQLKNSKYPSLKLIRRPIKDKDITITIKESRAKSLGLI